MEKEKDLKERVSNMTEKWTTTFLVYTKLDQALVKFVKWANGNRKGMFAITMTFLIAVVFVIFINRGNKKSFGEVFNEIDGATEIISNDYFKGRETTISNDIEQLFILNKLKNELKEIKEKPILSKDDSLNVVRIYNQIKELSNEAE